MKPKDRKTIPSVDEVLRDAAAICDPEGGDTVITALIESREDDDRPVTAVEDLTGELLETVRAIDAEDPAGLATVAAACWLATNPGQAHQGEHVLREGVRVLFQGEPPPQLGDWLAERGVSL